MGAGAVCSPQQRDIRVLMLGLDDSGKTKLLYQMKLGESVMTIQTIGFNVETVLHRRYAMTVFDVGGQEKIRSLWRHYTAATQCLVWVVDSSAPARLPESRDNLRNLLTSTSDLDNIPLLVLANKQDLPGAVPPDKVLQALDVPNQCPHRPCVALPTCGISGKGVSVAVNMIAKLVSGMGGSRVNSKENDKDMKRWRVNEEKESSTSNSNLQIGVEENVVAKTTSNNNHGDHTLFSEHEHSGNRNNVDNSNANIND